MSKKPIHTGHRGRVKEEFLIRGLAGWPDHRVLELILFYAIPQGDVNPLAHELIDRFGDPPDAVTGLLDVALVRNGAAQLGIREITQRGMNLLFYTDTPSMERIVALTQGMRGRAMFSAGPKPYFTVRPQKGQKPVEVIREVISIMEKADPTPPPT